MINSKLIGTIIFQALGDLDDPAGTQAVSTQGDELLRILDAGDAAGGLDLHMGGDMLCEQLHIGEGGAGGREAGGGSRHPRLWISLSAAPYD